MDFCYNFVEVFNKQVQTSPLISIFNLMYESSMIFKNQKKNYNYTLYSGLQIFVIRNNHEYGVLMDYK